MTKSSADNHDTQQQHSLCHSQPRNWGSPGKYAAIGHRVASDASQGGHCRFETAEPRRRLCRRIIGPINPDLFSAIFPKEQSKEHIISRYVELILKNQIEVEIPGQEIQPIHCFKQHRCCELPHVSGGFVLVQTHGPDSPANSEQAMWVLQPHQRSKTDRH